MVQSFDQHPNVAGNQEESLKYTHLHHFTHHPFACSHLSFSHLSLSLTHTHTHTHIQHTHSLSLSLYLSIYLSYSSSSSSPTFILSPSLNALFIILPLSSHRKWMGYILSSVPDIPDIFLYLRNQYTKNHVRFLTNVNAYSSFCLLTKYPENQNKCFGNLLKNNFEFLS